MTGKVVVSQLGARMHYAVPAIFAAEDRLAHFYTDICATKSWPRLINALPKALLPRAIRRLIGRRPKNVPADLITVFPGFGVHGAVRRLQAANVIDETANAIWSGRVVPIRSKARSRPSRAFRMAPPLSGVGDCASRQKASMNAPTKPARSA